MIKVGSKSSPFPFEMESVQFTDSIILKTIKGQNVSRQLKCKTLVSGFKP